LVDEQTRNYELMMIISPEANETEIDAASARVAGFIADRGGLIYEQSNWGLRRLAYPIQKFQEGNYVLTRFALEPGDIIELDSSLKASDDVMRHLTMKLDKSVKVEVPEPEPEPAEETSAEPVAELETAAEQPDEPVAEAVAELATQPEAEAAAEPAAQPEAEAVAELADQPEAEAAAEPAAQPDAEAAAEVETPDEPVTKGGGEQ
jgi:small subunit ribosomal protein S6